MALKTFNLTRLEDASKQSIVVETEQLDGDAVPEVVLRTEAGSFRLSPVLAAALAEAINDHLGNRGYR